MVHDKVGHLGIFVSSDAAPAVEAPRSGPAFAAVKPTGKAKTREHA